MVTASLRALDKLIDFTKPYLPKVGLMIVLTQGVWWKFSEAAYGKDYCFLVITWFRIDNKWSKKKQKIHLYAYVYIPAAV